jgi:hypothetical protein
MWFNRKGTWVAALGLVLLAGVPAPGQGLRDAQLFEPAEPSHYGGGVRANQGFFFVYDGLYWAMSPATRSTFGVDTSHFTSDQQRQVFWGGIDPNSTSTQGTTLDTSYQQTGFMMGQRIEVGQINEHIGWLFSYFEIHWLSQVHGSQGVQAYFNQEATGINNNGTLDGPPGTAATPHHLGVWFANVNQISAYRPWGLEFNLLLRTHPREHGGMWEWFFGPRFLQFNEQFDILASGPGPSTGGVNTLLNKTTINTFATNNIVGPQIGLRWFITNDRWQFSATSKFLAGYNAQRVTEDGIVASDLIDSFPRGVNFPFSLQESNLSYRLNLSEFSPVVELRVEGRFQLTKNIYFHGGWNGMYIGNIARPAAMIDYTIHSNRALGLLSDKNRDYLFMNGLSMGVEINR